ncbi:hypothetical protein Tco_0793233 [Tanacetum coccineum]
MTSPNDSSDTLQLGKRRRQEMLSLVETQKGVTRGTDKKHTKDQLFALKQVQKKHGVVGGYVCSTPSTVLFARGESPFIITSQRALSVIRKYYSILIFQSSNSPRLSTGSFAAATIGKDTTSMFSQTNRSDFVMLDSEDSMVTYTKALPSPDYVPGPEHPHSLVYVPYVPETVYPEFMPSKDDVLPAEEQPLPAAISPTVDSPGYITESDLEEDPEEDDEDPKEDLADYPTDKDNDDEEQEESS